MCGSHILCDHFFVAPHLVQEWHYTIDGPKDSPYEGGLYHGKLIFSPQYPYKVGISLLHAWRCYPA